MRRVGFKKILTKKKISNHCFSIYFQKNLLSHSRLGISISKQVIPSAVHRNLTKRIIRETYRINAPQNLAFDIVIKILKPLNSIEIFFTKTELIRIFKDFCVQNEANINNFHSSLSNTI